MKDRILIFSVYPAPYRMKLFEYFFTNFDVEIICESSNGDGRNKEWFQEGKYYALDTKKGYDYYKKIRIKDYNLVAVYDYSTRTGMQLIMRCIVKKIPYVVNCDGVILTSHSNFIKNIGKRFLLKKAAAYLASGENAQQYFIQYGAKKEKIYKHTFSTLDKKDIVKEPLSQDEKKKIRKKIGLPEECNIVIAVGRFIPLKRYNELIEIWKNMSCNDLLLIVGEGEEKEKYEKTILELKMNNVIIENFHKKEELLDYYKAADIFIHPTSYDVWGLVVNEAMACGLPVIVSDHCVAGLELVKNEKNGYIFPMGDEKKACEKVEKVLGEKELYITLSQNAVKTIQTYTIENMAKTQIAVFKKILGKYF